MGVNVRRPSTITMNIRRIPWMVSRLVANERNFLRRYDVPIPTLLRLWANGHFSYGGVLYDLDRLDLYLSDIEQYRTQRINGSMGEALRNKYVCNQFLARNHDEHLPETYGFVRNSQFNDLGTEVSSLVDLVSRVNSVVCKPISGGRGRGISVIEFDSGYWINGNKATERTVLDLQADLTDHLIVEKIEQHSFQRSVFSDSLNTMRIVTMVDPNTGEPFIAMAVHRFGVPESAPTDNWSAGGITARVNEETGELGRAVAAHGSDVEYLTRHPTTETHIHGETVPNWEGIREMIFSIASEFSDIWPYVGWDVTVDETGTPKIIEGNRATDVDIMQIFEPLLADEHRRRFYEYHGVV